MVLFRVLKKVSCDTKIQSSARNKQSKLHVAKDHVKVLLFQNRIGGNMNKDALYYVYAAIGTLPSKLGQNVMWKMIASHRGDKNLGENLTETTLRKHSGFDFNKKREGVVNLEV